MDQDGSQPTSQGPKTNAERTAKHRQKLKGLLDGTYTQSLLEQAKAQYKTLGLQDLSSLLLLPPYLDQFNASETEKLKQFVKNQQKARQQKIAIDSLGKKEECSAHEKTVRIGNQLIEELHQSLLREEDDQKKRVLIQQSIGENLYLFLDFMSSKLETSVEFLRIIISLEMEFEERVFTQLFVKVCSCYSGDDIEITPAMALSAFSYLTAEQHDIDAATGLLRLVYINNIELVEAPIDTLLQFQAQYEHALKSFIKTLKHLKIQVRESLPASMFLFTAPLIQCLKEGATQLYSQVPHQFLLFVITTVGYSFANSRDEFMAYLKAFKEGVYDLYQKLIQCNFHSLLQYLGEETMLMTKRFFRSLKEQTIIMERAFSLIKQGKIITFDEQIMRSLIDGDLEMYSQLKNKPSIINALTHNSSSSVIKQLVQKNPHLSTLNLNLHKELPQETMDMFRAMGIASLLPIQEIAFKAFCGPDFKGRHFAQFGTGQGKTALCIALATSHCKFGKQVFIVNNSKDLTFRDFKKANAIQEKLHCTVLLQQELDLYVSRPNSITFCSGEQFFLKICPQLTSNYEGTCTILDEFDDLLLNQSLPIREYACLVQKMPLVIGLTGSSMEHYHKSYIEIGLHSAFWNFEISLSTRPAAHLVEALAVSTEVDYRKEIVRLCTTRITDSPVIFITHKYSEVLTSTLRKNGVPVEILFSADYATVDSAVKVFNQKQGDKYSVFIVNSMQGRGIDFQSSFDIEQKGGVYVLIGTLPPNCFQFKQYVGRTSRIGNKGLYSVVILEKDAKNCDASVYLQKRLDELQNRDFVEFSSLLQDIIPIAIKENFLEEEKADSSFSNKIEQKIKNMGITQIITLKNTGITYPKPEINNELSADPQSNDDSKNALSEYGNDSSFDQPKLGQIKRKLKMNEKKNGALKRLMKARPSMRSKIDKLYFESYDNKEIHSEMLDDSVRMALYKKALMIASPGKACMDLGCGTGILTSWALSFGATHVHAIEASRIVETAKLALADHITAGTVTLIYDDADNFVLEGLKVDVLVSEWMGYSLLFEGVLPTIIRARDRYLAPEGVIIPSRAKLYIAAFEVDGSENDNEKAIMKHLNRSETCIQICRAECVVSEALCIFDVDIQIDEFKSTNFKTDFDLRILRDARVAGLVIWFDCVMIEGLTLSTSPFNSPTHWKQTMLHLKDLLPFEASESLRGEISVMPQQENHRALEITIQTSASLHSGQVYQTFRVDG